MPHGRIQFPANVPGVPSHHWCAAIAEATSIAHKGEVAGAKVLAGTCLDFLLNPGLVATARQTFAAEIEGTRYDPLLPPEARPPLNLNKEYMETFRPVLASRYVRTPVRFV